MLSYRDCVREVGQGTRMPDDVKARFLKNGVEQTGQQGPT